MKVIEPVNYVLQKSAKSTPFVVHADKLKKCFSPSTPDWTHSTEGNAAPTVEPAAPVPANAEVSTPRKRGRPRKESQPLPEVESQTDVEEVTEVEEPIIRTPRQRRPPAHLGEYICHRVQSQTLSMKIQEGTSTSRMDLCSSEVTCEVKLRSLALAATAAVVEVKYKY